MKRIDKLLMSTAIALAASSANAQTIQMSQKGDTTILSITNPTKYLLLPIEETKDEARVMLDTSSPSDTWMDIRLAQDKIITTSHSSWAMAQEQRLRFLISSTMPSVTSLVC